MFLLKLHMIPMIMVFFFSLHASSFPLTMFLKTSDENNTFLHKNKSHTTMKHKSFILCTTQFPEVTLLIVWHIYFQTYFFLHIQMYIEGTSYYHTHTHTCIMDIARNKRY